MDAFITRLPKSGHEDDASRDERATERPSKRVKQEEIRNSESDDSEESSYENENDHDFAGESGLGGEERGHRGRVTDFENALPPTQNEEDAIKEYEAFKSSQASAHKDDTTEKTHPLWIKGRSSIYVDAFNLALDTVLEEESHLFDESETEVFRQWRELEYEAQYL